MIMHIRGYKRLYFICIAIAIGVRAGKRRMSRYRETRALCFEAVTARSALCNANYCNNSRTLYHLEMRG